MGEAGPEAILPLKRGPGGKLGVESSGSSVTINVINNSQSDVETVTRSGPNGEEVLDIMIREKVKKVFGEGSMDRTMNNMYGLTRRGS